MPMTVDYWVPYSIIIWALVGLVIIPNLHTAAYHDRSAWAARGILFAWAWPVWLPPVLLYLLVQALLLTWDNVLYLIRIARGSGGA